MQEFYDNGMVKLKDRIEDEFWYSDYQAVMELITSNNYDSLGDFIRASHKEISSYREVPQGLTIAITRWCLLHWERKRHS
jgi:hypothetical protein